MGKKFNRLERRIEHEYEGKGISKKTSDKWAKATAGKIWREKECPHCGDMGHHPDSCAYKSNIHRLL